MIFIQIFITLYFPLMVFGFQHSVAFDNMLQARLRKFQSYHRMSKNFRRTNRKMSPEGKKVSEPRKTTHIDRTELVRNKLCNTKTCSKCSQSSSWLQKKDPRMYNRCHILLNLPKCCENHHLLISRF